MYHLVYRKTFLDITHSPVITVRWKACELCLWHVDLGDEFISIYRSVRFQGSGLLCPYPHRSCIPNGKNFQCDHIFWMSCYLSCEQFWMHSLVARIRCLYHLSQFKEALICPFTPIGLCKTGQIGSFEVLMVAPRQFQFFLLVLQPFLSLNAVLVHRAYT